MCRPPSVSPPVQGQRQSHDFSLPCNARRERVRRACIRSRQWQNEERGGATQQVFSCIHHHTAQQEKKRKNARTVNGKDTVAEGVVAAHCILLARAVPVATQLTTAAPTRRLARESSLHESSLHKPSLHEREKVKKESLVARKTERDDGSGTSTPAASVSLQELANAQWEPRGHFLFDAVAAVWSRRSRRSLHLDSRATRQEGRAQLSVFAGLLLFLLGLGLRPGITEFVKSHIGLRRRNNFRAF